jgi:hypothetical protein
MWSNTNSLIVSWLLTSVSPSIARMIESISNAAHVWKVLTGMYYGAGSVMMMMEVFRRLKARGSQGRLKVRITNKLS